MLPIHPRLTRQSTIAVLVSCLLFSSSVSRAQDSIPAVTQVRVSFDSAGVTEVLAEGWADRTAKRQVTADDPVRIASISKLVVALGVMRLVEEDRLDLDRDVSDYLGWPLRHPSYPQSPITLRLLLSHQTGLTDEAGYGAHSGTRLREQLTREKAWDPRHAPGTFFRYTNLNFPIVATVMEAVTGERFDHLINRLILAPLGIRGCFNWASCEESRIKKAVVIYRADGSIGVDDLQGRRPECPVAIAPDGSCHLEHWRAGENGGLFAPQGGLRISTLDLTKIGRLLLNYGEVDGVRLLKPSSIDQLVNPIWTFNGSNGMTFESDTGDPGGAFFCRYGLAVQTLATPTEGCRDDPWDDGIARVGHGGDAYGLVSGLWLDRANGRGVAFFISGGDLTRQGRRSAFYAVEEELLAR